MGSNGSISTLSTRLMPLLAILRHDLRALLGSWLVRLWLLGTFALTGLLATSGWEKVPTAYLIAMMLVPYLVFPWFFVVIALAVGPVSGSRAESLADGILSRPITRYEYLLASWAARVILVLGIYLVIMIPAIVWVTLPKRPPELEDTVTCYGIVASVGVVGLVLTLQVSLGFLLGTLLRRALLALVLLVFAWYAIINGLLDQQDYFSLESFSPLSLSRALPKLLRQPWREVEAGSQDSAEKEDPEGWVGQTAHFLKTFSVVPEKPVQEEPEFFNRKFDDFSLTRVVLGYGIPTLAAVALATLCFCWRDL